MKRTMLIIAGLAMLLAFGTAVCAADNPSAEWWGRAPGEKPIVSGTVDNVSPTNIAVKVKNAVRPFVVMEKTRVMIRGEKARIGDVKVGDAVIVHFVLQRNNVPTAARIIVPKPGVRGKILSFQNNMLVLKTKEGERRVLVTDKTVVRSHGYVGTAADLRVGYGAEAIGTPRESGLVADAVVFQPTVAKGTVAAIENGVITVKTVKQLTIPLQSSPATAVLVRPRVGPNQKGKLEDVKVGSPVNVGFHGVKGEVSPLLWVDVLTGM